MTVLKNDNAKFKAALRKYLNTHCFDGVGGFLCAQMIYNTVFWKMFVVICVVIAVYTAVAQWLRCCAANRKVAGSIPAGVIGIFHCHNPSDRTMALGWTQPLTEMSTRRISWV